MIAIQENLIAETLCHVFETMAFLGQTGAEGSSNSPQQPVLTEISFRGPKAGHIRILSDLPLGRLLAENIACLENPTDEAALDAWQEICNVTCGLVIPQIADSTGEVYNVSIPTVTVGESVPQWSDFTVQPECHVLYMEGYAVAACLQMKEPTV